MAEVAEGRVALMCEDVNRIRHQLVNQLMKHLLSRSPDGGGGSVAHQKGGGEEPPTSFAYSSPPRSGF